MIAIDLAAEREAFVMVDGVAPTAGEGEWMQMTWVSEPGATAPRENSPLLGGRSA